MIGVILEGMELVQSLSEFRFIGEGVFLLIASFFAFAVLSDGSDIWIG